jgi:hypothetical protein
VAGVFLLQLGGQPGVDDEAVVEEQLLAGPDVVQRLDEDAAVLVVGFAVRFAGVVDPARCVTVDLAVDDVLVVDVK